MVRHAVALSAVLSSCGPSGSHAAHPALADASTYAIRLERPVAVGARWRVVADGTSSESRSTYTSEVVLKKADTHTNVHLDAVVTALALTAGLPSRLDLAIDALEQDGRAVVARGKHLLVETAARKQDARVELDGAPAGAELRDALEVVFSVVREGGHPDEVFGTKAAQRIGETWPIAVEPTKVLLAHNGVHATSEAISGKATLAGKERVGSDDCLDVRVDLDVSSFTPEKPLPEGSQILKSHVVVKTLTALPLDPAHPSRRNELDVKSDFEAFVPVASAETQGVTVEVHGERHHLVRVDPL